jgi:bacterioferritin (cytochrome b1)
MASQKLLEALNKALAMDLRAIIQYMWQQGNQEIGGS